MKLFLSCAAALLVAAWPAAADDASTNSPGPKIGFDTETYEFGKAIQGDIVRHDFIVTNSGDQTLQISDVHPSCGCTTAGTWPREVAAGKSGVIPIQVNTHGMYGTIAKTISVTSNDRQHPLEVLKFTGSVWKPIDVAPMFAMFRPPYDAGPDAAPLKFNIHISNKTDHPIEITAPTNSGAFTVASLETRQPGMEFDLTIQANPPFQSDTNSNIVLKTSWSNFTIQIPTYSMIQRPFMISPSRINLPARLDRPTPYSVTIINNSPAPVQLSAAAANDNRITVDLREVQPGKVFTLTAHFPQDYQASPNLPAVISVQSSSPRMPIIAIPIQQVPIQIPPLSPQAATRALIPPPTSVVH